MNGRLGIGVRVPACRPATEIASVAARAERIGFDSVWIPASQLLWRDVWTALALALALAADRTGEIRLGTARPGGGPQREAGDHRVAVRGVVRLSVR